jgi:hypothetical protein
LGWGFVWRVVLGKVLVLEERTGGEGVLVDILLLGRVYGLLNNPFQLGSLELELHEMASDQHDQNGQSCSVIVG